jgi:hypothetical protein
MVAIERGGTINPVSSPGTIAPLHRHARLRRSDRRTQMKPKSIDPAELIAESEAAALIHVKPATLAAWRCNAARRKGLPYLKVGARVFYRRADISEWLAEQMQESA